MSRKLNLFGLADPELERKIRSKAMRRAQQAIPIRAVVKYFAVISGLSVLGVACDRVISGVFGTARHPVIVGGILFFI